ncbi:DEAD/DEAH box helicase family protein [Segetibacter koreensis]|uniref:DEAD/DEAH box helicase family protein n=1 Tax=Segetibacter koreensis TaxID=398037 RepID=UPI001FE0BF9D|nr:DEAD/DEAH box helicase family protein [Segetibacter koreensis]
MRILISSRLLVQFKNQANLKAAKEVGVLDCKTIISPADYILFVNKKPVGVIEAKREEEGIHLTMHEDQTEGYAKAKLRLIDNAPLVSAYESTGEVTRFTDYRDSKPRSRRVFTFHRPETFKNWLQDGKSLRTRFLELPALLLTRLRNCQVEAITSLETSFKQFTPKPLGQMATGSGKTFTAITSIYGLLKFTKAKREKIVFFVNSLPL